MELVQARRGVVLLWNISITDEKNDHTDLNGSTIRWGISSTRRHGYVVAA